MSILDFISDIFKPLTDTITKLAVPDQAKLELEIRLQEVTKDVKLKLLELESQIAKSQAEGIVAEAKGELWIQKAWRPLLMCIIMGILVHNYIVAPYVVKFFGVAILLELPEGLWHLLQIGVGGYVTGRSVEKIADVLKGGRS